MDRMTDDQFKLLLRHLQVIIAILGIIAGTLLAWLGRISSARRDPSRGDAEGGVNVVVVAVR
jgi:hypothetical protein